MDQGWDHDDSHAVEYGGVVLSRYEQTKAVEPQSYQWTSKIRNEDKQSGGYERYTAREKVVIGAPHRERSGQSGVKNEFQKSSTVKIGDQSGYTEYYTEQKVRQVSFGGNSGSRKYGGKKSIA